MNLKLFYIKKNFNIKDNIFVGSIIQTNLNTNVKHSSDFMVNGLRRRDDNTLRRCYSIIYFKSIM